MTDLTQLGGGTRLAQPRLHNDSTGRLPLAPGALPHCRACPRGFWLRTPPCATSTAPAQLPVSLRPMKETQAVSSLTLSGTIPIRPVTTWPRWLCGLDSWPRPHQSQWLGFGHCSQGSLYCSTCPPPRPVKLGQDGATGPTTLQSTVRTSGLVHLSQLYPRGRRLSGVQTTLGLQWECRGQLRSPACRSTAPPPAAGLTQLEKVGRVLSLGTEPASSSQVQV